MQEWQDQVVDWLVRLAPNRYAQALLLVVLAFVLARLVDWIVVRGLRRLVQRSASDIDDRLIEIFHRPLFRLVVLTGLGLATLRLELPATPERLALGVVKTLAVFVVLGLAMQVATLLLDLFSARGESQVIQARTLPLFDNVARVIIVGLAAYFIFLSWDIDVTAWLMSAGVVGIAVGFAAKDTLANLFSGVFILADAPYKLGDFIVLDTGERGRVTHVGLRSTRLLTRDDVEVTIPNSVMGNAKITNESGGPYSKQRLRVPVGVAYGSDVDQVRDVLLRCVAGQPGVSDDPEPRVRFRAFGDSSLDFELLCWIDEPVLRGQVRDNLNTAVYKAFAAEGIQIPFPQRDVWMRRESGP